MSNAPHAIDRVLSWALQPWALEPKSLELVATILTRRLVHGPHALDESTLAALRQDPPAPRRTEASKVALIPVHGMIAPRMTLLSDVSGGATFEGMEHALAAAVEDPTVSTIILDIDSPGGSVFGAHEFALAVMRARTRKPVIAQVYHMGTSAAYWAASAATEVIASPSAYVGNIGCYLIHDNLAKLLAEAGIERTFIAAGEEKLDGNPSEPLSDRARARFQTLVDAHYAAFVKDVCAGRGFDAAFVREELKARTFTASEALASRVVDRIAPLDDTLARFGVTATISPIPAPVGAATPQEPAKVTGQERIAELRAAELGLLAASF